MHAAITTHTTWDNNNMLKSSLRKECATFTPGLDFMPLATSDGSHLGIFISFNCRMETPIVQCPECTSHGEQFVSYI